MHPALFHPRALEAIQSFSKVVRKEFGEAILELQKGSRLTMPISRSMPSVAQGAQELRVRDRDGIYRVFYLIRSEHGVIVFHAFVKKTQNTPRHEIQLGQKRLREMLP